jgi:hypothetical protein
VLCIKFHNKKIFLELRYLGIFYNKLI